MVGMVSYFLPPAWKSKTKLWEEEGAKKWKTNSVAHFGWQLQVPTVSWNGDAFKTGAEIQISTIYSGKTASCGARCHGIDQEAIDTTVIGFAVQVVGKGNSCVFWSVGKGSIAVSVKLGKEPSFEWFVMVELFLSFSNCWNHMPPFLSSRYLELFKYNIEFSHRKSPVFLVHCIQIKISNFRHENLYFCTNSRALRKISEVTYGTVSSLAHGSKSSGGVLSEASGYIYRSTSEVAPEGTVPEISKRYSWRNQRGDCGIPVEH